MTGCPIADRWTRAWWVRPVSKSSSSKLAESDLVMSLKRVRASLPDQSTRMRRRSEGLRRSGASMTPEAWGIRPWTRATYVFATRRSENWRMRS